MSRSIAQMAIPGRFALALASVALPIAAAAQSVVFIDPGKSDEAYWVTSAQAMQSAAKALGMKLEVLYAERDHLRTVEFARQVASRPKHERPDFAIVTNDNATGAEQLRILDAAGVKTFFAYSSIPAADRAATGGPRERYKGWLGSLEPHAEDAGYVTARALIEQGRSAGARGADGKLHLIAIAGDRTTPSSAARNDGMRRAVTEAGDTVIEQTVYAGWGRDKAAEQAEWLYARYPEARLVWAGNDLMAFGAMASLEKAGKVPGKDAFFSGVNTSREAMDALRSGRLTALAGGHFITGAWTLVMLYDYAHGHDFASEGLDLDRSMFTNFDARSAEVYLARFGENFDAVDFRRYSKALNPKLARYDFDFGQLLR
ncbi:MAG TPA: ABC transporter substrate-binding protein [Usitatibacter sp.]|nr:ABC transporter substrate-binding protein [Usitatibacter sp.]